MNALILTLSLLAAARPSPSAGSPMAYAAAARASSAVVLVEYVLEREGHGFGAVGQRADMASVGTIVRPDGLVAVPANMFPEEEEDSKAPARPHDFFIRLGNGTRLRAGLAGRDADTGLAFLQLPAAGEAYPAVHFDPGASLAVGSRLVTIGLLPEKYGYRPAFVPATVSAVLPGANAIYALDVYVQDSSLGTPVFDGRGRAVGIITTDRFGDTSGGALTSALSLIGTISRGKEPGYPVLLGASAFARLIANPPRNAEAPPGKSWLGVTLQPVDRALAEYWKLPQPTGVMVTSVWSGSPADAAGLQREDVIVRLDGRDVAAASEDQIPPFVDMVQALGVGHVARLKVLRHGQARDVMVTLGTAPTSAVAAREYRNAVVGLAAQDVTVDVLMSRGWKEDTKGALVTDVENAGWAAVGGLRPGDLVLALNDQPVKAADDLRQALDAAAHDRVKELVFFIQRDADTLFIPVKTAW